MDHFGNGILIESRRLNEVLGIADGFYTFEKFRYMCIMSGCDYLPSLPGIGLGKACRVFKMARQTDLKIVSCQSYVTLKSGIGLEMVDPSVCKYYKFVKPLDGVKVYYRLHRKPTYF